MADSGSHELDGREETLERLEQLARQHWGDEWAIQATHFADGTSQTYAFRSHGIVDDDRADVEADNLVRHMVNSPRGDFADLVRTAEGVDIIPEHNMLADLGTHLRHEQQPRTWVTPTTSTSSCGVSSRTLASPTTTMS